MNDIFEALVDKSYIEHHRDKKVMPNLEHMYETLQKKATDLFEERIRQTNTKDPRGFYRKRLGDIKLSDPDAYREAAQHYREKLVPCIAEKGIDPLNVWQEYGCLLAELSAPGMPVEIDVTGKTHEYKPPSPQDSLILHIPKESKVRALIVGLPPELSSAQQATYDLLVAGHQRLRE